MRANGVAVIAAIFLMFILTSSFGSEAKALGLNDVTILFPLPTEIEQLPSPNSQYFALDALKQMPPLVFRTPIENLYYTNLRLIGVRLDPCFVEGHSPVACRREIRLIWQPLIQVRNQWVADDAAIHAFYDFDDATFSQILREWTQLPSHTDPRSALQVNPTILNEGLEGPYATAVKALVAHYCTQQTLSRLTFTTVNFAGTMWQFGGFNISGAPGAVKYSPMIIPRLAGNMRQVLIGDLGDPLEFFGSLSPAPTDQRDWTSILSHSVGARSTLAKDRLHAAVSQAYEIENPALANPGTHDCASCHMAQAVRSWGEANFSIWKGSFDDLEFKSPMNLKNTSTTVFMSTHVRMIGYTANEIVVAQRVINESAHVVETLQNLY